MRRNVPVEDRWAIIAYVRALQLSRLGSLDDVPEAARGDAEEIDYERTSRIPAVCRRWTCPGGARCRLC